MKAPADGNPYVWDAMLDPLARLILKTRSMLLRNQIDDRDLSNACHYFFSKVERRHLALSQLLPFGLYAEAMPLVRAAFEDWVNASYVFLGPSNERWQQHLDDTNITDAKVLRGLSKYGILDLTEYRDRLNEAERAILDPHLSHDRGRWAGASLARRATSVGLGKAYELAYPYLCEYTHGGSRHYWDCMQRESLGAHRDAYTEGIPAIWSIWAHMRVMGLCIRPFKGLNGFSDDFRNSVVRAGGYGVYITEVMMDEDWSERAWLLSLETTKGNQSDAETLRAEE